MRINPGMEGFAFTNTRLSVMDGERGRLSFCGYDIHTAIRLEERVLAHPYFKQRNIQINVDLYTGPLLDSLGLAADLFTPMFAVGRIAGWTAHMLEQHANNRLIRPRAVYEGPRDLTWVGLADRENGAA